MRKFRTYADVEHDTRSGILEQVVAQRTRISERLARVKSVVAVASGKGGVGKSAVTANLAAALATRGTRVGALDADLNGPSLGRMLGAGNARLGDRADGVLPPTGAAGVNVISMEMLQAAADTPLRWRGPDGDAFLWRGAAEAGVLREFLSDVDWGDLDWLLIDVPPGTDRIQRLLDFVRPDVSILVTTPAEMSRFVVAKSARVLREAGLDNVGIVANMTSFIAPDGTSHALFGVTGAHSLAAETGLAIWADIAFDPMLGTNTDAGKPAVVADPGSPVARAFVALADHISRLRDNA